MKKIIFTSILGLSVILTACGTEGNNDTPSVKATNDTPQTEATSEETNVDLATETVEEEQAKEEQIIDDQEQAHLAMMQEALSMYVDVDFNKDTKIFELTPTNEQLIAEIEMLEYGVGFAEWGEMVNGLKSMSATNRDSLGEGYGLTLANPFNEDNIILWIVDGEVVYNVVDDL